MPCAAENLNEPCVDLERFDQYYLTAPSGAIRFNSAGRSRLTARFARQGYALDACKTEAQFKQTLRRVLAGELGQSQSQLHDLLDSDACSADERAALSRLLQRSPRLSAAD